MQKTAYDMRISDWSSDVCSSDLQAVRRLANNWGKQYPEEVLPEFGLTVHWHHPAFFARFPVSRTLLFSDRPVVAVGVDFQAPASWLAERVPDALPQNSAIERLDPYRDSISSRARSAGPRVQATIQGTRLRWEERRGGKEGVRKCRY